MDTEGSIEQNIEDIGDDDDEGDDDEEVLLEETTQEEDVEQTENNENNKEIGENNVEESVLNNDVVRGISEHRQKVRLFLIFNIFITICSFH